MFIVTDKRQLNGVRVDVDCHLSFMSPFVILHLRHVPYNMEMHNSLCIKCQFVDCTKEKQ